MFSVSLLSFSGSRPCFFPFHVRFTHVTCFCSQPHIITDHFPTVFRFLVHSQSLQNPHMYVYLPTSPATDKFWFLPHSLVTVTYSIVLFCFSIAFCIFDYPALPRLLFAILLVENKPFWVFWRTASGSYLPRTIDPDTIIKTASCPPPGGGVTHLKNKASFSGINVLVSFCLYLFHTIATEWCGLVFLMQRGIKT